MAKGKKKRKDRPKPVAAPRPAATSRGGAPMKPAPAAARLSSPERGPASSPKRGPGTSPKRGPGSFLRTTEDPRSELRFEPRTSWGAIGTALGMSVGALAVGAGVYGQWLRPLVQKAPPLSVALYLLGAGAVIFGLLAAFGARQPHAVRVGDAGVAIEKDGGEIERIAWCDVSTIVLSPDGATVESNVATFAILTVHHPEALRAIAKEAGRRIEGQVEGELGPLGSGPAGEKLELDPPQVTGQRCRASDRLVTVEEDARLCGRCGELYHRRGVPSLCVACRAPLG